MRTIIMASRFEIFLKKADVDARLKSSRLLGIFLAGIIFSSAGLLQAQLINVDFNNDSYGMAHGGPVTGPTMSGAAVLGAAGDYWNGISTNNYPYGGIILTNANGSASSVIMFFTSSGGYDAKSFSGSTPFANTSYNALMEDYLFTKGGTNQVIILDGLATNATYDVVLYNAADTAAAGRKTFFIIGDSFQVSTWNGVSSNLVAGVNYVEFPSALPDGTGRLYIYYTGEGNAEGDVNGFQIQAVPGQTSAQTNVAAAYTWTTFAGNSGVGSADGVGGKAQFLVPASIATDKSNNVYVTDTYNFTIRKITPAGVVSTIAGLAGFSGTADGIGNTARFYGPNGLTVDKAGNLYVSDTGNDLIRKLTPVGTNWVVSTIAGNGPVPLVYGAPITNYADGLGTNAHFYQPEGITVDANTNLFVVDNYNCVIRELTPVGGTNWLVKTIAGSPPATYGAGNGRIDGTNSVAKFNYPVGITIDTNGNLFVGDAGNNAIRQIKPSGTNWIVTTITGGSYGSTDGTGSAARFYYPAGITIDSTGNLYVADADNDTIRKITSSGVNWIVSTFAGLALNAGSTDGTGGTARFNNPDGVAVDSAGSIYVADTGNNIIRKITSDAVAKTFAGSAFAPGGADGTGSDARFTGPYGIVVDNAGTFYVADSINKTIRQISPAGIVTTMAGLAGASGSADGVGSDARFGQPQGLAVDGAGNVFVTDFTSNTVRKITASGVVTTIAGLAGTAGTNNGTGNAARFYQPTGIAVDANDTLYVADSYYNTIRKITPNGNNWVVTTIAGVPNLFGGTDDGMNNGALFDEPQGIAIDANGNLYVADGTSRIRKMTPVGTNWIVTTIAGLGFQLNQPFGIAIDNANNLYVSDTRNCTIRKLTLVGPHWSVTTIGGQTGVYGSVDGAGTIARFANPEGIAVNGVGDVYVADYINNTIRNGVFTAYGAANMASYTQPMMTGKLVVTLLPPEANGQWRFPWEIGWHNSGEVVSNLAQDNYTVEFRSVPGWLAVPPILSSNAVQVTIGATTYITNYYYPTLSTVDTNSGGSLTVNLGSSPPSGAGWRFLGENTPFFPSGYGTNLPAGTYLIQFAGPFSGRSTPPNLAVQVFAGLPTVLSENYPLVAAAPAGMLLPFPVPSNNINNVASYPFGFNGQLQSDVGYGSGVAVQTNVVLTAAHLVFNDQTLSYVSHVFWYFRQETGAYAPEPQTARGWYVLSSYSADNTNVYGFYASERTNDLQHGYGPDQSTPESRNLDVAAIYFEKSVAGGGYGGYLPSDAVPDVWLAGTSLKMLAGYPVDGSEFGNASIVPGVMYQTDPQPYPLSLATDPVGEQQEVYLANWFLSYPGNSGGPVYVQYNGYYYPAGIYLGTLYSGVTPYASAVRAIDSAVVNLITNAATLGDSGINHTGGGVLTVIPNQAVSAGNPGYLQFQLGPPAAVAAVAGWRLVGDTTYSSATNYIRAVFSTNAFAVEFKPINGWNLPTNQAVAVQPGHITSYSASYTASNPAMVINAQGIGITGTTNTVYRIEGRTSLATGNWLLVSTNTITTTGFNLVLPAPLTNAPAMFYRAVWLP